MSEEEIQRLERAVDQKDWDRIVAGIRDDHGGQLPPDWAEKVESSGLKQRVTANFGATDLGSSPFG